MNPIARAALEAFELAGSSVLPRRALEDALARNGALCRETCDGVLADLVREGLIAPAADPSIVRRTEAGRLALRGPLDLTLYTRAGCHLCDEMKAALVPIERIRRPSYGSGCGPVRRVARSPRQRRARALPRQP